MGNVWFKQEQRTRRINHGVGGAHASIPFQCEGCWMINLEGRLPEPGLDDAFVMCLRRANLDAMGGRAKTTIMAHANAVSRLVQNCKLIRKTPSIPHRGAARLGDDVGMGVAVDMLLHSITARPRLRGEKFVQFDSVRKVRGTFTLAWESSPTGLEERNTFVVGTGRVSLTTCPTQQKWFGLFLRGMENRMGYVSQRNQPLSAGIIPLLLDMVKEEAGDNEERVAAEFIKFGAAVALATCGSLRGPEVFLLDLAGLHKYIELGKTGVMPIDPMKDGTDLSGAPYVIAPLIGEFKGESGARHHLMALASTTRSGIELREWVEKLMAVRAREGHRAGPAFGYRDGSVATIAEYDDILFGFLRRIQIERPDLLSPTDPVGENYSLFRTFRRTAEGRARIANLDTGDQNAMNRWRKIEGAKGKRPRFNMVEHYSHARELMSVTWRYSFVQ